MGVSQWSDADIEFLYANYSKMKIKDIADALGKSYRTITLKANKLGLSRNIHQEWTEEQINYLKLNYNVLPKEDLEKHLNRSWSAIAKRAFDLGLKREIDSIKWTSKEEDILRRYLLVEKQEVIQSYLPNRSWSAIMQKALDLGLNRSRSLSNKIEKGYVFNDDFFSSWTPEMAWVLGWIVTDGTIQRDSNRLKIELNSKDKDVLYKIGNLLMSEGLVIREDLKFNRSYISMNNSNFIKDLNTIGVYPNKTFTVKVPSMPTDCIRHFIRGAIEGDGGVYTHKAQGYDIFSVMLCGNKYIVTTIKDLLKLHLDIDARLEIDDRVSKGGLYKIRYYGANAISLCNWMYKDTHKDVRLDRKYETYVKYIKSYSEKIKSK